MPSRYLALVRHGQYHQRAGAPSAFQPYPLNEEGQQQAYDCAAKLLEFVKEYRVPIATEIHSSVMLRAWQTADTIRSELSRSELSRSLLNKSQGNPSQASDTRAASTPAFACTHGSDFSIVETPLLGERCVGSVANLTVAEVDQILRDDPRYPSPPENWKSNSHYQLPFPGAESLAQAGKRVSEYLVKLFESQQASCTEGCLQLVVGHGAAFRHAAYELGVLEAEQIAKLSMFHATPVFLQLEDGGNWKHVSGAWKVRKTATEDLD